MTQIIEVPNEKDYRKMLEIADALGIKYISQKNENQIAELDKKDWIIMPQEFSGLDYSLEISPGRISKNSAVENIAKKFGINYKNTSKDYLGREFVGNNNFYESQKLLHNLGTKMPTILEENKFIKMLDEGSKGNIAVYDVSKKKLKLDYLSSIKDDILKVVSPWRAEWLDADFKAQGENLIINFYAFDGGGNIVQNSEVLNKNSLIEDRAPGISLNTWLENPTSQGLPSKKTNSGKHFYLRPREGRVARFFADSGWFGLYCSWFPFPHDPSLGVRPVALRKQ